MLLTWIAAAAVLIGFGLVLALTVSRSQSLSAVVEDFLVVGALGLIATLGFAALGSVTNYGSGRYHLGAIR